MMKAFDPFDARDTTPFLSSSLVKIAGVARLNMPRDVVNGAMSGVALPAETEMASLNTSDVREVTTKVLLYQGIRRCYVALCGRV